MRAKIQGSFGCVLSGLLTLVACGGDPEVETEITRRDPDRNQDRGDAAASGDGAPDDDLNIPIEPGGDGDGGATPSPDPDQDIEIVAEAAELTVDGAATTLQFNVEYEDGDTPNSIVWLVDDTKIGAISQEGVFTANGFVGGVVIVTAQVGSETRTFELEVNVDIVENPDGLSKAVRDGLREGGKDGPNDVGPDGDFSLLYPYDRTVFPQGIQAPQLQLGGADAEATYVRLVTTHFSYEAFADGQSPGRLEIPAQVWDGLAKSALPEDGVEVQVSKRDDEGVTGPVEQLWTIAQGSLRGIVYYNTYKSPLAGNTGAVMRIRPGNDAEVLLSGCTVCHSVSANGNVLVAGVGWDNLVDESNGNPRDSASYALDPAGEASERNLSSEGRQFSFGGLTPNGEQMLVSAVPPEGAGFSARVRGLKGEYATRLVDTATGDTIAAPSLTDNVTYALTPSFSPDGTLVAFGNLDANPDGEILSLMNFDNSDETPIFSDLRTAVTASNEVVGWPSFTPDSGAILYHAGDAYDTGGHPNSGVPERLAELRLVDLANDEVSELAALNGYDENGELYLPLGADEARMNYEPTVLPVPVGGYYWVMFTSRRTYGNTIGPGGTVEGGETPWATLDGAAEITSPRKKIWVSAIDLDYSGKADPSHPAFYLPGQELESGNMRAFAALEPCRAEGSDCESAAQCCNGFCRQTDSEEDGTPILQCVPPPENSCSMVEETCEKAADCCDNDHLCINGRCALPAPPTPRVR